MDLLCVHRLDGHDLVSSEQFDCYEGFGDGILQKRMLALFTLAIWLMANHTYSVGITAGDVDHWCKRPPHANVSELEWKSVAIPIDRDGQRSRCHQYAHPDDPNDTTTVPCAAWNYDQEKAMTSMVSQWNLVCDRLILRGAITAGNLIGGTLIGILAGSAADANGRRPVLLVSIAVLLLTTTALSLTSSYAHYVSIKFIASGSVAAAKIVSGVLLFEFTAHKNRPLHVVVAGAVATVAIDFWFVVVRPLNVHWALKQAIFLAPTYLSAPALCVLIESPRWLVAKGRLEETEAVMIAAAEANLFPLHKTACLINRLKKKAAEKYDPDFRTLELDALQGVSIRKRAFAVFFSYFSVFFIMRVVYTSTLLKHGTIQPWISFVVVVLAFAATLFVITRVTMLEFISTVFLILGVLECLLSVSTTLDSLMVGNALLLCVKALGLVSNAVSAAYSLELFPTAVRGTAFGWLYGSGFLGAIAGFLAEPLRKAGREDVTFAASGCLMFASLFVLRVLPANTTVECAQTISRRASSARTQNVKVMKETLEKRDSRDPEDPIDRRDTGSRRGRPKSKISTSSSSKSAGSTRSQHR